MTNKTELMLENFLKGINQADNLKRSEKPNIPPTLLRDFLRVVKAIKTGKRSNGPVCLQPGCVWLKDDGYKGTCFWKRCLNDKGNTERIRPDCKVRGTHKASD